MEEKLRTNAVRKSPKEQYELRKSIIRLVSKGKSNEEIAETLDVSERHVRATKKTYAEYGLDGLKPKKRGRKVGEKRRLTPEQEKEIQGIIADKTPEQLQFRECMWTRNNIQDLIKRKYKMDLPLSTMGYYLQRWGFSVQRPVKRAYKQDEQKVAAWLNEEFPGISEQAKEENAGIFFGDETCIQTISNHVKGYAPVGQTPIVRVEPKRMKINMLSAVSHRGKLRFVLYKDDMNADNLIDFMRRLVHDSKKKVFLILDSLRVHHSTKACAWLDKHKDKIEVFVLPPYAQERIPDELLNSNMKRSTGTFSSPRSEKEK